MTLGALLDAGLPFEDLRRALGSLAVDGYHVHTDRVLRAGVSATKFSVHEHAGAAATHAATAGGHDPHSDHDRHQHSREHIHGHSLEHVREHPHEHVHEHSDEDADGHGRAHGHSHRSLAEIFTLIDTSALSPAGRDRARALFQRLAE